MSGFRLQTALLLCLALLAGTLAAQEEPGCLDCHTPDADTPVHAVFKTAHANLNGGGANTCIACHGTSEAHDRRGRRNAPDISFGPTWLSGADSRNGSCLSCHEKGKQLLWMGSEHQQENMACNDCHNSHTQADLLLQDGAADSQCLNCHSQVQAEIRLPSRHPIAEGKTSCNDCHNPHGGSADGDLHAVSLNDNCLGCHEEKRGPQLWEHEPVTEDCGLCHKPHGSVNDRLLTVRGPALCQQCHSVAFHPSLPYGAAGLSGGSANRNLLGKNCLNCHSQIHGSNHPSGARLTR
jgi:DmsE family decaheme c-type cytochrome